MNQDAVRIKKSTAPKNWRKKFDIFYGAMKKKVFSDRGIVPAQLLKKAEKNIDLLKNEYNNILQLDIKRLDKALLKKDLETIYKISHELRGTAGTFDYSLLSIIGDKCCHFIEAIQKKSDNTYRDEHYLALNIYISTLKIVYAKGPQACFGEIDKKLVDGLKKIHLKYFNPPDELEEE